MAVGVIPSREFNDQIVRTVREAVRARNGVHASARWHKKGGSGGGGDRVAFTVMSVVCPDDDEYDDIETTTLTCEWTWHTKTSTPTDAYGANNELIDVTSLGCVLDTAVAAELPGSYGEATYGYTKDDPVGFWKLDSICIVPECE